MRVRVEDVVRSLRASAQLLSSGGAARPDFDVSEAALARSFSALPLIAPATVTLLAAQIRLAGDPATALFGAPMVLGAVVAAQLLYILAMPAMLTLLAPTLLRLPAFTAFVIAWNWVGILTTGLMALPAAVFALGWSPAPLACVQAAAFFLIVLRLRYCVARAAFGERPVALLVTTASAITDYAVLRTLGLFGF